MVRAYKGHGKQQTGRWGDVTIMFDSRPAQLEELLTFKNENFSQRWREGFPSKDKWDNPVVYKTWLHSWFWASE